MVVVYFENIDLILWVPPKASLRRSGSLVSLIPYSAQRQTQCVSGCPLWRPLWNLQRVCASSFSDGLQWQAYQACLPSRCSARVCPPPLILDLMDSSLQGWAIPAVPGTRQFGASKLPVRSEVESVLEGPERWTPTPSYTKSCKQTLMLRAFLAASTTGRQPLRTVTLTKIRFIPESKPMWVLLLIEKKKITWSRFQG